MTEIEAKFILRQTGQVEDVLRVLDAHGYRVTRNAARPHVDRYFDTPDWALYRAGWAFRCRTCDDVETLGLKSFGKATRDVFVREEIEQPLPAGTHAEPARLPAGPVQARVDALSGAADRRTLFSVHSERTIYAVESPGDAAVRMELDLDRTRVEAPQATEKAPGTLEFTELEFELRSGPPGALESLARLLRDELDLTPARYSKFDRGIQAAGLRLPDPGDDWQAEFDKRDPVLDLLFGFLAHQLATLEQQQPRAFEGIDPEGVHQMRVAIRRLRAVLRAFGSVVGDRRGRRLNEELRWLARQLGRARDADVLATAADAESGGGDPYARHLERDADDAYTHLVGVLESDRYRALHAELKRLVDEGPGKRARRKYGKLTIAKCSKRLVAAELGRILARGDAIDANAPPHQLHKLRIEAKRFRYLLDFFSLAQKHRWQAAIQATKKLQDVLGDHQDAVTALARLQVFAASIPRDEASLKLESDTERRIRREQEKIESCRQAFRPAWKGFRDALA